MVLKAGEKLTNSILTCAFEASRCERTKWPHLTRRTTEIICVKFQRPSVPPKAYHKISRVKSIKKIMITLRGNGPKWVCSKVTFVLLEHFNKTKA